METKDDADSLLRASALAFAVGSVQIETIWGNNPHSLNPQDRWTVALSISLIPDGFCLLQIHAGEQTKHDLALRLAEYMANELRYRKGGDSHMAKRAIDKQRKETKSAVKASNNPPAPPAKGKPGKTKAK